MASSRNWGWLVTLIGLILKPLLKAISPLIKDLFEDSLYKLLEKARATENPIDDYFVEFLFDILDVEIPDEG